jgi:mannose-6-phosphate isomerase-like protein (cupin superfamily)
MRKILIIILLVLFTGVGIIVLSVVIGFEEDPSREIPEGEPDYEQQEDFGKNPWVLNIEEATIANRNYRIARWSGEYLQMVLMSLKSGESIDLEVHDDHDQFIRIEQGNAQVVMGETMDNLNFDANVTAGWAVFIPAGYWHQVRNTGDDVLKLYTLYAPSEHPEGTIHETYEQAAGHQY